MRRFLKRKVEQHADVRDRLWELVDVRWVNEGLLWRMDGESQGSIVGEEFERLMIGGELERVRVSSKEIGRKRTGQGREDLGQGDQTVQEEVSGGPRGQDQKRECWLQKSRKG